MATLSVLSFFSSWVESDSSLFSSSPCQSVYLSASPVPLVIPRHAVSSRVAPRPTTWSSWCRCPVTPIRPNSKPARARPSGSRRRTLWSGPSNPFLWVLHPASLSEALHSEPSWYWWPSLCQCSLDQSVSRYSVQQILLVAKFTNTLDSFTIPSCKIQVLLVYIVMHWVSALSSLSIPKSISAYLFCPWLNS